MLPALAASVRLGGSILWCTLVMALVWGCSNSDKARDTAGITPAYDATTGKLKELAYDSNQNGKPDTWTDMDGARPVQTRIDRNEDGKIDRWEYYDEKSKLVKVGFSRTDDGKADAWAFAGAGRQDPAHRDLVRRGRQEDRSLGALRRRGMTAAEEDTNHDGAPDKWETYEAGLVKTAAFDEEWRRQA